MRGRWMNELQDMFIGLSTLLATGGCLCIARASVSISFPRWVGRSERYPQIIESRTEPISS